jgi:hypothetical protein
VSEDIPTFKVIHLKGSMEKRHEQMAAESLNTLEVESLIFLNPASPTSDGLWNNFSCRSRGIITDED